LNPNYKVAPKLAEKFSVVAADLRGYGDSSKPEGGAQYENYSKRAMVLDMVLLSYATRGLALVFAHCSEKSSDIAHPENRLF